MEREKSINIFSVLFILLFLFFIWKQIQFYVRTILNVEANY